MEYGIIGLFIQPLHEKGVFVGDDLLHHEETKYLTGRLKDIYGESSIEGILDLDEEIMVFVKKYDSAKDDINYRFQKHGEIWRGEFSYKGKFEGEALCEIFPKEILPKLDWEDIARYARLSIGGEERWAKNMTQTMINEGWLEEIRDDKTGEILLKPSDNPPKYSLE